MFPKYVPCIFPCVFHNLRSQEKTSPDRKTTFIFFIDCIPFIFLLTILWFFIQFNAFKTKSGPYGPLRALWAHMGPNPDPAPTRTGPQPGPGPTMMQHQWQTRIWQCSCHRRAASAQLSFLAYLHSSAGPNPCRVTIGFSFLCQKFSNIIEPTL